MLADGLEFFVQPSELIVHPIQVRGQRAKLVLVWDFDVSREITGGDLRQARLRPLDRADQRPRENEAQKERKENASAAYPDE